MTTAQKRLRACALVVVLSLTACSSVDRIRSAVEAQGGQQATVERVRVPYTQARVQINKGTPGRLFLAQTKASTAQWVGSDGLRIWTRNGRIIATDGLRDDLLNLHLLAKTGGTGPPTEQNAAGARSLYAQVGGDALGFIVQVEPGKTSAAAPVAFGMRVETLARYTERVRIPSTGAHWTNEYWFRPETGQVVITRQRLPGVPYDIRMEQLP